MEKVKKGNVVKVHYTGTLDDQTVFDSSKEREPLEFTVGAGQMIQGFDNAVEGMKIGEVKTVKIPSNEAYGPVNEQAIFNINKSQLPDGLIPEIGMQLESQQPDGRRHLLSIVEVMEEEIKLDGNHPLAGKDLTFEIEMMSIKI